MKSKEEQFWNWFTDNQENLHTLDENDINLFDELTQQLRDVHQGLSFELSTKPLACIKDLYISANGIKKNFPVVIDLIKVAPKLPNWSIKAFRQRIFNDDICISTNSIELSYSDLFFSWTNDYDKIALEIHARAFQDNDNFINAIYILLDALLGEYDVGTQISCINWVKLDEKNINELLPFIELRRLIDHNKAIKN
ncbi:MAG: hypothetical protein MK207_09590 [Saprospiraceae bacterium]|nr:hypothetical protein [Saprospiraceae bacterium]